MCVRSRTLLQSWAFAQLSVLLGCVSSQTGQKSQNAPQQEQSTMPLTQLVAAPLPAPPPGASNDVTSRAPAMLVKDAFAEPESVLYDPNADNYLVSNLNGAPDDHDDNGFISRVSPDGRVLALKWIDGARLGVELHAPKGMAISGDVLYVADIDRIRKFNVHSGSALGAITISGASALKDVSAGPDGTVFFSDRGARAIGGRLEPTGQDAVYKLVRDQPRPVMRGAALMQPNALWAEASALWVVTYGSNEIYDVRYGSKVAAQRLPTGVLDGVIKANDGRVYISSWASNVILAGELGSPFEVAYNVRSPGDIGYDAKRNWLLIPITLENAVKLQPL